MAQLPQWLRTNREEKGVTQAQLAKQLGVPTEHVAAWENGSLGPSPSQRAKLVRILGTLSKAPTGQPQWWDTAVSLKDKMSLRELAAHVGVSAGTLSSEFRRRGVRRTPNTITTGGYPRQPVEARRTARPTPAPIELPSASTSSDDPRPNSKDSSIMEWFDLLGKMPDSKVASLAGVSVRTIASFRKKHAIDGYKGPRRRPAPRGNRQSRLDDYRDFLGKVPDQVVAEHTQMSLGAVRNYRVKHGIKAAGRMRRDEIAVVMEQLTGRAEVSIPCLDKSPPQASPRIAPVPAAPRAPRPRPAVASQGFFAWRITYLTADNTKEEGVVVCDTIAQALSTAASSLGIAEHKIEGVERLGKMI